ncbi:hypothetical protein EV183_002220 [Coemansia sp. RSA 2336]|nr:hypothetical protein EV183_002220 [Coemansia sp. RSA 2336]
MASEANLDELAKQLDQSLSLGDQHASTTASAVAADELERVSDSSVPEKSSDVESLYSVPSAVGSLSSIDEDAGATAAAVVQVPLTAYTPALPKKAASLFAAAVSPLLAQKNLLLRHYTQNIDCLERVAGVESALIVEAHGSFHSAHCISTKCRKEHAQDWVKDQIFSDKIPHCTQCKSLVKPDITFFGEGLPQRFFELLDEDFDACDLLIVMGTSLQVHPFASLIDRVSSSTPRLLVNRERVGESGIGRIGFDFDGKHRGSALHRDALILGDCDEACLLLADHLGWKEELLKLRAEFIAKQKLNGT